MYNTGEKITNFFQKVEVFEYLFEKNEMNNII